MSGRPVVMQGVHTHPEPCPAAPAAPWAGATGPRPLVAQRPRAGRPGASGPGLCCHLENSLVSGSVVSTGQAAYLGSL